MMLAVAARSEVAVMQAADAILVTHRGISGAKRR
jgi:hypothetical protein